MAKETFPRGKTGEIPTMTVEMRTRKKADKLATADTCEVQTRASENVYMHKDCDEDQHA